MFLQDYPFAEKLTFKQNLSGIVDSIAAWNDCEECGWKSYVTRSKLL